MGVNFLNSYFLNSYSYPFAITFLMWIPVIVCRVYAHKHWCVRTHAGRCYTALLMRLLPSGPAASWHLSPWRRLIASSVLARGERRVRRKKPSLHPFICFFYSLMTAASSFYFSFVLVTPLFVPFTLSFYLPITSMFFITKNKKWRGKKKSHFCCFKSSCECQSRFRTHDIAGLPPDLNPSLKRCIWMMVWIHLLSWCFAAGAEGNSVPFSV